MANVKVAVRVRPFSERELSENGRPVVCIKEDCVEVTNLKVPEHTEGDSRERVRRFAFDLCFDSSSPGSPEYASQEMVYQRLGCEVLDALLSGYNACVLAYGQSGSGKTYTMAGGLDGEKKNGEPLCPPAARGLSPRICEGLFARLRASSSSPASTCTRSPSPSHDKATPRVRVSFLEIYKERVRDLLQPDDGFSSPCRGASPPFILRVREHPRHGPYVQGLKEHVVEDASSLAALVSRGEWARRTGCTAGNPRSSRGHALLAICPLSHHANHHPSRSSHAAAPRLHLVDLAGSERAGTRPESEGGGDPRKEFAARLKEGASINRSLVTLGNVISALAERCSPQSHQQEGEEEGDSTPSTTPPSSSSTPCSGTPATNSPSHSSPISSPRRTRAGQSPGERTPTASFFVPYRDSVLTWLLKDSLGGNSKTVMVAAISPSNTCYNETISTLRYAQRTKCIVNSPVVNDEDPNARIIRELRAEVRKLRGMLLSVQMAESLHCRQPDGVTVAPLMEMADGVEGDEGRAEEWTAGEGPRANAAEPFYLQGCQRDGEGRGGAGTAAGEHCDASSDGDGTPTASLTEPTPEGATRCAVMGREDSMASETTVEDDTALSTPPLGGGPAPTSGAFDTPCFEEAILPVNDSQGGLPPQRDPPPGDNRSPLGRAFGGSCELVYSQSANGHRVAESLGRTRGRSMSSGGIWSFRRQSSVDAPNGPPLMRPTQHDDRSQSSSSLDSKGSADSSRLKSKGVPGGKGVPGSKSPEGSEAGAGTKGRGRPFQVRTGVAEARRRAAEQARRRAEIVAAVTRRLYPTKRRGAGQSLGALGGDGVEGRLGGAVGEEGEDGGGGEGSEGRTEAEGEAAAEGGGMAGEGSHVGEAVSRARFRLLSRRALGAARKTPPRPVTYVSTVTQTDGGEMREAGVGTETPGEGLPLGPLARGVLAKILIEGPLKPEDISLEKWFSEDSLESSEDSEDDKDDCENGPCGRLVSISPGKWEGAKERPSARPLTDLFWECKNGGWGTWGGEQAASTPPSHPHTLNDSRTAEDLPDAHAESGRNPAPSQRNSLTPENLPASGKEKVREWQMRTLPPDSFEENSDEGQGTEQKVATGGESTGAGDPLKQEVMRTDELSQKEIREEEEKEVAEEDDSWGDSSCDDASVSSADSDFLFLPPPPTTPAPRPPPIPARRQLYTITENSEHSDFSDAASVEALSRRSTPPSSLEHIREDWRVRSRGGGECEVKEQTEEPLLECEQQAIQVPEETNQEDRVLKSPREEFKTDEDVADMATPAEAERVPLPQRKDPDGDREEKCRGEASRMVKTEDDVVMLKTADVDHNAGTQRETNGECNQCRARKKVAECEWCKGGAKVADECRFLNVSILGRPEGAVPVSIGMVEGGPFWGSEGAIPASTASEDSITFVFVGRPPYRKGSKAEPKCATTLPPVLVELIRRSLGGEGRKRNGSWIEEEENDEGAWLGRRGRGRAGLRRCRRQGPLRRSVSVDTAVRALSRFVRMQGMRSCSGRPASTECLVPEEMGAILEQGRLHAVGEEGGGRGAEGGAVGGRGPEWGRAENAEGGEGPGRKGTKCDGGREGCAGGEGRGSDCKKEDSGGREEGANPPVRAKVKGLEKTERGDGPGRCASAAEGSRIVEEVTSGARDKGGGEGLDVPYRFQTQPPREGSDDIPFACDSPCKSSDAAASSSRVRNPEECPLPDCGWGVDQDDFDDDYYPSLPRVTLGRTIMQETESDSKSKKMQLQEMRNVVFGFPEVVESRGEERRRRAGAKSVSWGDEGAGGSGRRREVAEGCQHPRPIIKRSTSLPTGDAAPSARDGVVDQTSSFGNTSARSSEGRSARRRLTVARTKSPRPDGSFANCPVHNFSEGTPKGEGHQPPNGERSDEDSSGEEFEERACRALSDFLVEATTLLEGLCRASGLSSEGERRKKGEEQELCSAEGDSKLDSPLDAKEVLAALQTRLSDRHLMRSPPKATKEVLEERNSNSRLHPPSCSNPPLSETMTSTFETRFCSLYDSLPNRGETRFGVGNSRECTQAVPPVHLALSHEKDNPICGMGDTAHSVEEEISNSSLAMPSGTESKSKLRLYPESHGASAMTSLSEFQQVDSSMSEPWKARLPEFPIRNCNSVLLNTPAPAAEIRRSESEGLVTTKMGSLNRPSSPDLFPDFGRPRISGREEDGLGASLLSNWSPRLPLMDEEDGNDRDMLLRERAWRSSNALYVPPQQHPAPLRESQSDAALCSTKSWGGCCLHGHCHRETRVHHHHHHYHHYPPFVESEYKQKWENMVKRLSWSEQDEEEDSFNLWRGSAPQLSSRNPPSLGTYDYVQKWQQDNLKVDPRGVSSPGGEFPRGEDCHTPFSSAPNSPYRSRQHSPPGSLPLSPTHQRRNNPPPRANHLNPPYSHSLFSTQHGGHNPLARSLSDSLPHSLSRPLNLPLPTQTPPQLRSPTHPTSRTPSHSLSTHSHVPTVSHLPPRVIPPLNLSSSRSQTSHGPNNGSKFQSSPLSAHVQQTASQFPPYSPYRHGMVSPPHHPQGFTYTQPSSRSSHPSHSPTFVRPPTDLGCHESNQQTIGNGLAPHAYLRHLVDVRKEVVAATRSCNPHTQSSASSHPT